MRIQHNILAMNAYRNYTNNTSALGKNLEKLSSGYKINRAGDDAAGLAISEKMRAQITGLNAAQKNVKDGISLVKTAEGAMQEIHDMLNRMDYLATQSANGTYDDPVDRLNLQKEVESLKSEINRIADSSNFNGINLLDGMGGMGRLSKVPVEFDTISTTKGISVDSVNDGGGSKGTYTITIDKMFSLGDTFTVTGTSDGSSALNGTYTVSSGSGAGLFKGSTIQEQAKSLANAMAASYGGYFDIEAKDNQVILTAKTEGIKKVGTITSAAVGTTNANVSATGFTSSDGNVTFTATAGAAGTAATGTVTVADRTLNLIGNGTGSSNGTNIIAGNIKEGDKLTFAFTNAAGKLMTTTITATGDMCSNDAKVATQAVVDYLNNKAYFDDNASEEEIDLFNPGGTALERENTTGIDESKIKVGDMFTFTAAGTVGMMDIDGKSGKSLDFKGVIFNDSMAVSAAGTAASVASAATQVFTVTVQNNFTNGDKIKFEGTLADGRKFEIELEAGKDFEVSKKEGKADAEKETLENIKKTLLSGSTTIKLKDKNGNDQGETMTADKLFGDGKMSDDQINAEFKVDTSGSALTITAMRSGTATSGAASNIDKGTLTPIEAAEITLDKKAGDAQSSAESKVTFGEGLGYGAAVKIGDNTYEIVADAADTSSRKNTAVVVKDLTDSNAVAQALRDAVNKNETNYTATSKDGTVTVASKEVGSDQKALAVSLPYGDKVTTAHFQFDPSVVKEGSKMEFMDQKYEFIAKGGKASDGAIGIEVEDFSKATAKSLGDAFADVVKVGSASVAADGTVTLKGVEAEDGTISDPVVKFDNNLVLQIGDTADSFNQLTVALSDMHTAAMGIDGVDISKQASAQSAIDVIKNAINYVSSVRGDFGAIQNRLEHTANNLSVMAENIQDAESTIRDTDVAEEMMSYTKNNILIQSAQAMLAQANAVPQGVLQLLG